MSADKHTKKHFGKKNKNSKSSSTKGILKGESCRKSVLKNRGAKDQRFYKTDPDGFRAYEEELVKVNKGTYFLPKIEE